MAKNIIFQGNTYNNTPAVQFPIAGSDSMAKFVDITDTTAVAADVVSGKQFYAADGVLTTGTYAPSASTVKKGVIRPDAELVDKWTMDSYAVADLGLTIPAYSTSNVNLRTEQDIEVYVGDPLTYRYFITGRTLTIPVYNIATLAKGREEYAIEYGFYEWLYNPSGQMTTIDGSKEDGEFSQIIGGGYGRELYWRNETSVSIYASNMYCARQSLGFPTIGSNKNLTIKSPAISIRGSATYLAQTFFEAIEDIHCQYVIELWRVPLTGVDGWVLGTQMDSVFNDIANNRGKLT